MNRLEGKAAIVTGGGSGIGKATATLFAKEGAKVVVADWVTEWGEEAVRVIRAAGGEAVFVKTDVSETTDVQNMIKTAVDTYGKLNVLFNNAGILELEDVEGAKMRLHFKGIEAPDLAALSRSLWGVE